MTSIFEGQPPQNKAELPIKTRGPIWVPGIYIYIHTQIYTYIQEIFNKTNVSRTPKPEYLIARS